MSRKWILFAVVTAVVLILDQWSKYVVLAELTSTFDDLPTTGERVKQFLGDAPAAGFDGYHYRSKRSVMFLEKVVRWRYAENPGAAFGLFRTLPDNLRGLFFHFVSIGAVVLIVFYYRKLRGERAEAWALAGLPLVLGGAVGNWVDRIARGFVIDFIDLQFINWPSFNVADSAICVGVGLLVIDSFVRKEEKEKPREAAA